jgi:hypothetical protein
MRISAAVLILIFASSVAAVPGNSHHAFAAEFDINRPVTLRGTITLMEWINPHAWLHIDVQEADGTVAPWAIELGPPNSLVRRGWSRDSVPVGMEVRVEGHQSIDGGRRANGGNVILPDGTRLFTGGSTPEDDGEQ